jgi:Skp family chaperone for outer membrane proteins
MKKSLTAVFGFAAILLSVARSNAQTAPFKAAVFDIDIMVQAMPEYRGIDSLVQLYERDTLGAEYQIYQSEYQRLDSTFKSDSALKKPQSVLDYTSNQKQQMAFNLVYWQQIAQNKSDNYRAQLAQPLFTKVVAAYKKVLATKKYNLILKTNTYEVGTPIDNLFPLVAKELNVTLPPGLMGDPNQALQDQAPQQKPGAKQ